jgi:quinol monooxygenase YgiN
MIAIMWQFEIKQGREKAFEEFYGVEGEWTAVNRHSRSYIGSSFLRDQNRPSRYLLIEYWSEMVVYEQHKAYRSEDRQALHAQRDDLVTSVEPLGVFTALDVPDRAGPAWSWRGEK